MTTTENPADTNAFSHLTGQIKALVKNGDTVPDISMADGQLIISIENKEVRRFNAPIKTGTVLNFIRRYQNRTAADTLPDIIEFGPFRLDPRQSSLTRAENGDTIILTDKERDILAALWLAPEQSLSRDDLLAAVWAYADGVETHTLETHIYRLRQKIEADPANPVLLVNRDGAYRLNA